MNWLKFKFEIWINSFFMNWKLANLKTKNLLFFSRDPKSPKARPGQRFVYIYIYIYAGFKPSTSFKWAQNLTTVPLENLINKLEILNIYILELNNIVQILHAWIVSFELLWRGTWTKRLQYMLELNTLDAQTSVKNKKFNLYLFTLWHN